MIGFIPVGVIGGHILRWRIIPFAVAFSLCIETVQLVSKVGLFEFDDIIHNCLGAAVGFLIYVLVMRCLGLCLKGMSR